MCWNVGVFWSADYHIKAALRTLVISSDCFSCKRESTWCVLLKSHAPAQPSFRRGSPGAWCHINKHRLMEKNRLAAGQRKKKHKRGILCQICNHDHSAFSSSSAADRFWHSHSFNVGTAGAKIFTGPAAEEFGYQVQQATNHEGKWYEQSSSAPGGAH